MGTYLASAARTVSGTAVLTPDFGQITAGLFLLDVTAAATAAGDTLDVYIQQSIDGGTTYDDFIHFTQVIGTGGAVKHLASWSAAVSPESEMRAPADAALAAGVLQGPVGSKWRIKWVVVSADTPNFTFSVEAELKRN